MQKLNLERKFTRETAAFERGRAIVLTLHAKFMTLRLKGTRESYTLPYDAAFSLAAKQSLMLNGGK
jgi:hypothetical protein